MFYSVKHFNVNKFIFFWAENPRRAGLGRGLCMFQDSLTLPGNDRICNCGPQDETWGRGVFSGIADTNVLYYNSTL